MTELEIVQHAKTYIDKMANGTDPLTGEPVKEDDLINNVRISRCLFYVSGILEKVIANGGYVGTKPKVVKEEFALPEGALASFRFSDRPIPVSEIAARLNALKQQENMKDLTAAKIADWLVTAGFLAVRSDQKGKNRKYPTEQGAALGLSLEHRTGQYGDYDVVLYNIAAQRFVVDNLDAILAPAEEYEDE